MDPKEQAESIIEKYQQLGISKEDSVSCAKIHVQGIISSNPYCNPFNNEVIVSTYKFWAMVLQQLMDYGTRN